MIKQSADKGYRYKNAKNSHAHAYLLLTVRGGFQNVRFHLVGRIPALAKSMIAVAEKPPT